LQYIPRFAKKTLDLYRVLVVYSHMEKKDNTMNTEHQLYRYSKDLVTDWFKRGKGLRGNPLKNFTSGDWVDKKKGLRHSGLEGITEQIINKGLELYNLTDRSEVNSNYFHDPNGEFESQRMDWHIWIDGKVVILEEDRAWMDKPFYTLKRSVIRAFMLLPYVKEKLHKDIVFIFNTLQRDVKDLTRNTRDMIDGYGDRIVEINLSGMKRRAKKYNYFDNGVDYSELRNYVNILCEVFEKYEK
jgi:hypothetical protein